MSAEQGNRVIFSSVRGEGIMLPRSKLQGVIRLTLNCQQHYKEKETKGPAITERFKEFTFIALAKK